MNNKNISILKISDSSFSSSDRDDSESSNKKLNFGTLNEEIKPQINGKDALDIDFHEDLKGFPWRDCKTREELE